MSPCAWHGVLRCRRFEAASPTTRPTSCPCWPRAIRSRSSSRPRRSRVGIRARARGGVARMTFSGSTPRAVRPDRLPAGQFVVPRLHVAVHLPAARASSCCTTDIFITRAPGASFGASAATTTEPSSNTHIPGHRQTARPSDSPASRDPFTTSGRCCGPSSRQRGRRVGPQPWPGLVAAPDRTRAVT